MMNNLALRQLMRKQRLALNESQQQHAAAHISTHVAQLNRYRMAEHIAFYLAHQGEVCCAQLLHAAHQAGKNCYLPVLHPRKTDTLCFIAYAPNDPLVANRYGILEPIYHEETIYPTWKLDLVITPLVAFDATLNRLGMGKGYYDRTFAFLNTAQKLEKPYLLGLAYEMQKVEQLNTQAHDVPLASVVTEKQIYTR